MIFLRHAKLVNQKGFGKRPCLDQEGSSECRANNIYIYIHMIYIYILIYMYNTARNKNTHFPRAQL